MSGMLSKAIKSNIITGSTKYKNGQEKIGEVIEVNEDTGTCTVSLITRDGINSVLQNVGIILDSKSGVIGWTPSPGDYVKVTEQYKRFMVTGKVDLNEMYNTAAKLYKDMYPEGTGGGGGHI